MAIAQFRNGAILLNLVGRIHSACHQSQLSELSSVLNLVSSTTAGMCCAAKPQISISRVQAVLCAADVCSLEMSLYAIDRQYAFRVPSISTAVTASHENLLIVPH